MSANDAKAMYSAKLLNYLWKNLRNQKESKEQFEKRIEDGYFAADKIDVILLTEYLEIPLDPGTSDGLFRGNYLFLKHFKSKSKSKLKAIISKVNRITEDNPQSRLHRTVILYYLLMTFVLENYLKPLAQSINSQIAPNLEKEVKVQAEKVLKGLRNLVNLFVVPPNIPYFQTWFVNPITEKASSLGLSQRRIEELIHFIEHHQNAKLSELAENRPEGSQAKRAADYSPLTRDTLKSLHGYLRKGVGIKSEEAKRYMAAFLDLFDIRPLEQIIDEFAEDEVLDRQGAEKISAKRIGDVIHKKR